MTRYTKVVFLVLAHKPDPFNLLIKSLGDAFDCFVHVDARVPIAPFKAAASKRVRLIEKRTPIFWGGNNSITATLDLIRTAIDAVPDFGRLALISGDCLPVADLDTLQAILGEDEVEFIQTFPVQNDPALRNQDPVLAVERYGWRQPARFQTFVFWDHELLNPRGRAAAIKKYGGELDGRLDEIRKDVQEIVSSIFTDFPPRPPLFEKFFYGASWWAISREATLQILDQLHSDDFREYFKYFRCADEHFIHCAFGNNPALHARKRRPFMHLGHPMVEDTSVHHLKAAMLPPIHRETGCLFARKFDPAATPDIAQAIAEGRYFEILRGTSATDP